MGSLQGWKLPPGGAPRQLSGSFQVVSLGGGDFCLEAEQPGTQHYLIDTTPVQQLSLYHLASRQ